MTKKIFKKARYDTCDKSIEINSEPLTIYVDYDDVNHKQVKKDTQKMINILNRYWESEDEGI